MMELFYAAFHGVYGVAPSELNGVDAVDAVDEHGRAWTDTDGEG